MGLGVFAIQVVRVVGGHQREVQLSRQFHEFRSGFLLVLESVPLEFDVEIPLSEDLPVLDRDLPSLFRMPQKDQVRNLPGRTRGERDQAFRVFPEQVLVHSGTVVEPLQKSGRHHLYQVSVPHLVLREQDEMVRTVVHPACGLATAHTFDGHVHLGTEDRLDARVQRGLIELDDAEHVAVIRDRQRGHLPFHRAIHQIPDPYRAVQETVHRMIVQMNEIHRVFSLFSQKFPFECLPWK